MTFYRIATKSYAILIKIIAYITMFNINNTHLEAAEILLILLFCNLIIVGRRPSQERKLRNLKRYYILGVIIFSCCEFLNSLKGIDFVFALGFLLKLPILIIAYAIIYQFDLAAYFEERFASRI